MTSYFTDAILSLRPGAELATRNDNEIIFYEHSEPQPTEAEIQAEMERLAAEVPWNELRTKRNQLLAESDWVSMKAIDASIDGLGIQLPQAWMDYRQALRDLPANTTDPANPDWPVKPGGDS